MRKRSGRKGRLAAVLLSAAVLCQTFPVYSIGAAQETDGTCTHHPAHTAECGYADGMAACQFVCGECQTEQEGLAKAEQEAQQEIENVQGMIDALPDAGAVTAENLESVKAQITAIDEAKAGLDEAQQGSLVLEKYRAVVERIAAVEAEVKAARKAEEEAEQAAQESQKKIENVQKMIDALPEAEAVTAEELENVKTQLATIEKARAGLDEAQQAGLNLDKYNAVVEKTTAMETQSKPQKAPAAAVDNPVARVTIGGETKNYSTLCEAISAADGKTATITLLQSTSELVNAIINSGDITLQLNGYTINDDIIGVCIYGGKVTITGNGTVACVGVIGAEVSIEGGKIGILHKESGSVVVKNGTIETMNGIIDEYEPTTVNLNPTTLSLVVGGEVGSLTATIPNISVPTSQTIPYEWSSDEEEIAKVSGNNSANATVTAVKAGTTNIKVKVGNASATCKVTVKDLTPSTMNMTITGANGNSTNGYTCAYNSTITLNATLAAKTQNTLAEGTGNGTVSFYLGDPDKGVSLGAVPVSNNGASLQFTLSGDMWGKGFQIGANKITAVFSGNATWKSTTSFVKLTVTKAAQASKPEAPTQSKTTSATENSITLENMSEGENNVEFGYVESKTDGTPTSWQESPVFEKLKPGTSYIFYARYAGNDYYEPSAQSEGKTLYTLPKITTDSLTATVKQTFNAQLEAKVATGADVTWELINNSKLPAGLSLASDGKISGTPTVVTNGPAPFDVQATANGVANTKTIYITVNKGTPSIKLEDKNKPNFVYTYGDTITLAGTITSGSQAEADKAANTQAAPETGQAALFLGETRLTEPVTVKEDGTFTLTYDTKKQGISATGESQTLTVKYGGNDELNAGSQDVAITLNKASRKGSVTVSGEYVSGNKLTASYKAGDNQTPKDWTLSYQWYRGDSLISGAEGERYTLTENDIGQEIYVKVTGESTWYYDTVESEKKLCKKQADSPSAPQKTSATADSITIKTVSGQEYLCTATETEPDADSKDWITGDGNDHTFEKLFAGTAYDIWTYIPENDSQIASEMVSTQITTNEADYLVTIPASPMTAGNAESIGSISVKGTESDTIDLGYTGRVVVTAPGTVTLTRKNDTEKTQIQSALEVKNGEEWQEHNAKEALAVFTEDAASPVSICFSEPKSLDNGIIKAGEYEGTMTFTISYEETGKAQEGTQP